MKYIVILLMLTFSIMAKDIKEESFIGEWKLNIGDNVVIDFKAKNTITADGQTNMITAMSVYVDINMSNYNTDKIVFKSDRLLLSSYLIITNGKWKIENNKYIENTTNTRVVKNTHINVLEVKDKSFDESMINMMIKVIIEASKIKKSEYFLIKSITKNEIVLMSDDQDKIELKMIRVK